MVFVMANNAKSSSSTIVANQSDIRYGYVERNGIIYHIEYEILPGGLGATLLSLSVSPGYIISSDVYLLETSTGEVFFKGEVETSIGGTETFF